MRAGEEVHEKDVPRKKLHMQIAGRIDMTEAYAKLYVAGK